MRFPGMPGVPSKGPRWIETLRTPWRQGSLRCSPNPRSALRGWHPCPSPPFCPAEELGVVYRQPVNSLTRMNANYQQAPPTDSVGKCSWIINSNDHCLLSKNLLSKQYLPKWYFCRLLENRRLIRGFNLNPSRGCECADL